MRTLFKSMAEISDYVTVDISGNFKTISPYLVEAHKFVLKGLDKATFDLLLDYVENDLTTPAELTNLLPYARRVLANFAYAVSAKRLGIYVGENGIMEFANQNLEPVSPERLEQVRSEFFNSAFNALEALILFIQDNRAAYPASYSHLFSNSFFVSTARELNKLIFTDVQNRDFFEMKQDIFLIEKEIEGILGAETFNILKDAHENDSATSEQSEMLDLILPAEACLAYGIKFKSEKHEKEGRSLLEQLRIYYSNIMQVPIERFDNEGKRIYVFG